MSAYVSDLPGCIATGKTVEEIEQNIREAIELHLEGMAEDGESIPNPAAPIDPNLSSEGSPQDAEQTRSTRLGFPPR